MLDSRGASDVVRRRRQCLECERRFTTYERIAPPEVKILKRDGTTQAFDREKLERVVRKVTRGRPVGRKAGDDLVRGLELELTSSDETIVKSSQLARRLLDKLGELDPASASRFAAAYLDEEGVVRTDDKAPSPQMTLPLGDDAPVERSAKLAQTFFPLLIRSRTFCPPLRPISS